MARRHLNDREKTMAVKIEDVKEGSVLIADDGFTCLKDGAECVVERQGDELGVKCSHGFHDLEGQVSDDGTEYVGFELKTPQ